jgi:hypothetical protein
LHCVLDFDILIYGRQGLNSFINGLWVQKRAHNHRPYYVKGDRFLYCDGTYWLIVDELGSDQVYARLKIDTDEPLKFQTPNGTTGWEVLSGNTFEIDTTLCLEPSYGVCTFSPQFGGSLLKCLVHINVPVLRQCLRKYKGSARGSLSPSTKIESTPVVCFLSLGCFKKYRFLVRCFW